MALYCLYRVQPQHIHVDVLCGICVLWTPLALNAGNEITDVHQPSGLSQLMFMTACLGKSGLGSLTQLYLRLVGWEGKRVSACMRERKEERENQSLVNPLHKAAP